MEYKYLISFSIPEPFSEEIRKLMDIVEKETGIPAPYKKIPPKVTFHRPLEGISEETICNLAQSMALQSHQTRITVSHLFPFGKHYIVLPVHATRALATLWVGLTNTLSSLAEYEHDVHDHDNTLHITIAEKTTPVFDLVWPILQYLVINPITIPVKKIRVDRKPIEGGDWEKIAEYDIPA